LHKGCGLRVTSIKINPYLNVDAGTMSPFEHGETYVLDDGGETDLNLGNCERFLRLSLMSVTTSHREGVPQCHQEGEEGVSGANRLSRKTKFLGNLLRRKTEVFSQTMEQQMTVPRMY